MPKIACIFPGQGAQYPGMGKELAQNYKEAMNIFDLASERLGIDMKKLCFEGDEEELKKTENTQPSILTVSIALLEVLKLKGIEPQIAAGLSLGEYSALVASKAISFADAVALVKKRGKYMQEAVPAGEGTMAAIMGIERESVMECLKMASGYGVVEAANFNCPGQVVIAGHTSAVEKACSILKERGARKAIMLPVSAPFHSSLLKPAGEKLAAELENVNISDNELPVVSNVNAQVIMNKYEIKRCLIEQVSSSVLWEDSIRRMIDLGVDTFIEVGPGRTLSAFVKKIDKSLYVHNVENIETMENTIVSIRERLECN
ncbi:MAG TPA: ACP S-malonyltransferase [Bacillota bacterium]|nr:ACP S-malonyltransferase [Clostridiaceae bacterium]HNR04283.1 ACP S-malonyltransferase [Bacillota bacterium]HNT03082.1 ACP S-malonyltransferase [Bacillota bacterium]HPX68519.1 ACP S-malonyltransferase [Bacillota bacterium]HQA64815.1 ACP S-malonyltransferase [Bacillota bacterium]